jgi:mannose-6-phosphate isomerase-like protein (cupin superfamily)
MDILDPEQGAPEVWREGVETRMRVSARAGSAQLCIFEQWCTPGAGAPTHRHAVEEVLTIRSGRAEVWVGDETRLVLAGQSVIVPAGRGHGFRNAGDTVLHVEAVLASPIFEALYEDGREAGRRWQP